jgi:RNA polymerase II subunit A small phosphatase-like protein
MENVKQAKPLLILDLDEALVHAIDSSDRKDNQPLPGLTVDFWVGPIMVYKRPHLSQFLTRVWQRYDVAVWSSGGKSYVEPTVKIIMADHPQPLFVWSSDRCTRKVDFEPSYREFNIKNLQKLWKRFDKNRMLIVDDSPEKCIRNYGSAIYIKEFLGDQGDDELLHLAAYLESLADEPNFRTIEKRGWRNRF